MTTDCDRKRDEAIEYLDAAVLALNEVVIQNVPGWLDYKREYREHLTAIFTDLLGARNRLRREI